MTATKANVQAYVSCVRAIAETVREVGECPESALYVPLVGRMSLETFNGMMRMLVGAGLVSISASHLVCWVGPK